MTMLQDFEIQGAGRSPTLRLQKGATYVTSASIMPSAASNFWLEESQRLIDAVGADFLHAATFDEVVEKTGPAFSYADRNQMRSVWAVATQRLGMADTIQSNSTSTLLLGGGAASEPTESLNATVDVLLAKNSELQRELARERALAANARQHIVAEQIEVLTRLLRRWNCHVVHLGAADDIEAVRAGIMDSLRSQGGAQLAERVAPLHTAVRYALDNSASLKGRRLEMNALGQIVEQPQ
ncbi:hypothetical protein EJP67_32970 [Variovorax guangxiensis]|uniref:Uncharacterized protein n=1 Tax=Variovorax guangxiensis TaxID=1775474 RepID=A0A3S0Z9T2_9BURK|nr:hypothetical protein [Variovorax guangxiensis]RUR71870.1 hypothetical protein EJP67_32970 [Variovorax guangxiensis]